MAPKVAASAAIGRQTRSASKIAPATPPSGSSKAATKGKVVPSKPSGSKAVAAGGSKAAASDQSGGSKAAPTVKVAV